MGPSCLVSAVQAVAGGGIARWGVGYFPGTLRTPFNQVNTVKMPQLTSIMLQSSSLYDRSVSIF